MNFANNPNELNLLFIGDIVARPGREAVLPILPSLKAELNLDIVIANAENLSGGKGINQKSIDQMVAAGVDVFTGGNHIFSNIKGNALLDDDAYKIIRPANYPPEFAGVGYRVVTIKNQPIVVMNFEGNALMRSSGGNPFVSFDEVYERISKDSYEKNPYVIVDFHAEATSEKRAFGFYVDGKVTAVFGSHTHVPTADLGILPHGTFYVTDAGMVGSHDSVLGVKKEIIVNRFVKGEKTSFSWEYVGEKIFNAVFVKISANGSISEFSRCDRVIA